MFLRLLFLLTFIPFVEIYFLIQLSDSVGFGNTILVVLATGLLGAILLRRQGHSILMDIQKQSSQGQVPSDAIARGFFTFVGGLLLLTPGILTDAIGLSFVFPLTQALWKRYFMGHWKQGIEQGSIRFYGGRNFPGAGTPRGTNQGPFQREETYRRVDTTVIDVEAKKSETTEKGE